MSLANDSYDLSLLCAFPQDLQFYLLNIVSQLSLDALVLLSYTDTAHAKCVSRYILLLGIQLKRKISLGRLAIQGDLHLLEWTQEQFTTIKMRKEIITTKYIWELPPEVCAEAAKHGHFEILKWARNNGCEWNAWTTIDAAESGHLQILQWALENGCECDELAFMRAIKSGHLDVVKWMLEYRNSADDNYLQLSSNWVYKIEYTAALCGQLDILVWVYENYFGRPKLGVYKNAIRNGHLNILKWFIINFLADDHAVSLEMLYDEAARCGQIEMLEWFTENNGTGWHSYIVKAAIQGECQSTQDSEGRHRRFAIGQINVLQWLINKGHDLSKNGLYICQQAATSGALNVLQWARELGYPWDKTVTKQARINNSYDVYKWAIENGCPVNHAENNQILEEIAEEEYWDRMPYYSSSDDDEDPKKDPPIITKTRDQINGYHSDPDEHLNTTKLELGHPKVKAYTDNAICYEIYSYVGILHHGNQCETCAKNFCPCGMRDDRYVYDTFCDCFVCITIRKIHPQLTVSYDDFAHR